MVAQRLISGRYEIRGIVGRGGMGLVYKAHDNVVGRDVALKTLGDVQGRAALDMFYKEWRVLANLHHPNIVEIFDIGEFEDEGVVKPFFVMPLLIGMTLEQVMHLPGQPLAPERLGEIVGQACRGLQALHDTGLVHRDLKPSNIFVMDLSSVKLIDFGVAHLVHSETATGLKGTIAYMAPEQIERQECTPASDIFSLGVVCYEALAGNRPFTGNKPEDILEAILHHTPNPIYELNPAVSQLVSRVVHKALAKQPRHRYVSALEFGETLQQALRGESIPALDPVRIQPRIERAKRAFELGNYSMATDILSDLEAAGHIDTALTPLRNQIDEALRRQKIHELLERAQMGLEQEEFGLALQNLDTVLRIDCANQPAVELRDKIHEEIARREINEWLRAAREAADEYAFPRARQLLGNILQLRPANEQAAALLLDLDARELAYRAARQEKEELFIAAKEAWRNLEFATAAAKLERVLALERSAPDSVTAESEANYQNFLNLARIAEGAIEGARSDVLACINDGDYDRAMTIASEHIAKYPGHPIPQGLKLLAESKQKRSQLARMTDIGTEVANQPELRKKLDALQSACALFPNEPIFEQWMRPIRDQLTLANAVVAKARAHEEREQFEEALEQWRALRTIYPDLSGLETEIERVKRLASKEPGTTRTMAIVAQGERARAAAVPASNGGGPKVSLPASAVTAAQIVAPRPAGPSQIQLAWTKIREMGMQWWAFLTTTWSRARVGMVRLPVPLPENRTQRWIAGAALAAIILIVVSLIFVRGPRKDSPHMAQAVQVTLSPGTRGAEIRLEKSRNTPGKDLHIELAPGEYHVEESLDGYDTYKGTLSVGNGGVKRALPSLQPLPAGLHIFADLQKANVQLDQRPRAILEDLGYVVEDIARGAHTVLVHDSKSEAQIRFVTQDGHAPVLESPVAKDVVAFVVAAMGSVVSVSGSAPFKAAIDGSVSADVPPQGYRFTGIHSGPHTINLGEGKEFPFETGARPAVWIKIYSDRNVGTLLVKTNLDQFKVFLDGKARQSPIHDNSMLFNNMVVKSYQVRVEADGYAPREERFLVKKAEIRRAELNLYANPATLVARGAPAGTQVLLDGNLIGTTSQDGFRYDKVDPAEHTVEFRHAPQYKSTSYVKTFPRSETVPIAVRLERNPTTVTFTSVPEGAQIEWTCGPGGPQHNRTGEGVQCAAPNLEAKATLDGYEPQSLKVSLNPGAPQTIPFELKKAVARVESPQVLKKTCSLADLTKTGWTPSQGSYVASNNASLPCSDLSGTYAFTMLAAKKAQWVLNGVKFTMDKKAFTAQGGSRLNTPDYTRDGKVTFRVIVASGHVIHEIQNGATWERVSTVAGRSRFAFSKDARIVSFSFSE